MMTDLEAIVNSVVHRSYAIGGDHIRVELFEDRLEVESPARRIGRVTTSQAIQLLGVSRPTAVAYLGRLESAGMLEAVRTSPRDPRGLWRLRGGGTQPDERPPHSRPAPR